MFYHADNLSICFTQTTSFIHMHAYARSFVRSISLSAFPTIYFIKSTALDSIFDLKTQYPAPPLPSASAHSQPKHHIEREKKKRNIEHISSNHVKPLHMQKQLCCYHYLNSLYHYHSILFSFGFKYKCVLFSMCVRCSYVSFYTSCTIFRYAVSQ